MAKTYVRDIREKEQVKSVFQVVRKTTMISKGGKPFLAVVLRDKTGELDARIWEGAAEADVRFARGDLVLVEGPAQSYQGRVQLRIDTLEKTDGADLNPDDFVPPPRTAGEDRHFHLVCELADRVHDQHVRALLRSFLDDESLSQELRRAHAPKAYQGAFPGGLCERMVSVMRLANRIAEHYPAADRDLLVAGAFLNEIGKVSELASEHRPDAVDEARLVGRLVTTVTAIHERASAIAGFPRPLLTHLLHLVAAHRGPNETGSPRLPQTLEAMLLAAIDEMDTQVATWLHLMQRDPGETWTDFQKSLDRPLFKGAPPTVSGRAPVERRARGEKRRKDRHGPAAGEPPRAAEPAPAPAMSGESAPKPHASAIDRPQRGDRTDRRDRPPRQEKAEEKLTFKPFAALSGPTEPASPAGGEASASEPESATPPSSPGSEG